MLHERFQPQSVVDLGCGGGQWAAAFLALGTPDVIGIDGPWVPAEALVLPEDRFEVRDLSDPQPLARTFDLALCLEVAEHLPHDVAPRLVHLLARAAPVVVFSAAIPGQGGDGHVNEQPASYWADLFAAEGLACHTDLRSAVWNDRHVEVWYRQNLLCFARPEGAAALGLVEARTAGDPLLDIAHPDLVLRHMHRAQQAEAYAARQSAEAAALRERIGGLESELKRARDASLQGLARRAARRLGFVPSAPPASPAR